jgi:hypothetical protein
MMHRPFQVITTPAEVGTCIRRRQTRAHASIDSRDTRNKLQYSFPNGSGSATHMPASICQAWDDAANCYTAPAILIPLHLQNFRWPQQLHRSFLQQ